VLRTEAQALLDLAGRLGKDFAGAVDAVAACKGHLVVTGMGKAGLIGQKISATFASTAPAKSFPSLPARSSRAWASVLSTSRARSRSMKPAL